ncbi:MAG: FHA domain-containing protein [Candidatus Eisenbacteria bacterium]|nr:FHA domain-containing protein [Candidatus Eisenbacteria bacterium]
MTLLLCSFCSRENREGSFFCAECGAKLHFTEIPPAKLMPANRTSGQTTWQIANRVSYVGRDASNDIVFPEEAVSKKHAKITFADGKFYLEDLESSNGTFVNGERLAGRAALKDGDVIRLGSVILRFELG